MAARETYLEVAESFADLVAALPADLAGPGLGEWDLRALVGHTSRALTTVSDYLRRPAETVDLDSSAAYVAAIVDAPVPAADIVERGRQAGAALGDAPADAVRRLLESVADDLVQAVDDPLVATLLGGMRLGDYLPTRTFELVVHGLDIAAAVGRDWAPPAAALHEATHLAAEVALRQGRGARLLRLATGRDEQPFSVV